MRRSVRVVDDKQPSAIRLPSNHFGTQSSCCQLGLGCRRALDDPLAVQKRKAVTRFYDRTRCQGHLSSNREHGMKRRSDVLPACYLLTADHQNRVGFIQRNQRLNITKVECILEQSMDFGGAVRAHQCQFYTALIPPRKTPKGLRIHLNRVHDHVNP